MVETEQFYIKGTDPDGKDYEAVTESYVGLHLSINKFLDKNCTVITITRGKPGAP